MTSSDWSEAAHKHHLQYNHSTHLQDGGWTWPDGGNVKQWCHQHITKHDPEAASGNRTLWIRADQCYSDRKWTVILSGIVTGMWQQGRCDQYVHSWLTESASSWEIQPLLPHVPDGLKIKTTWVSREHLTQVFSQSMESVILWRVNNSQTITRRITLRHRRADWGGDLTEQRSCFKDALAKAHWTKQLKHLWRRGCVHNWAIKKDGFKQMSDSVCCASG